MRRDNRYANGHRRRKVRARVLAEEDVCWLCGRPVDKDLPARHPDSAEVDEIIPVSLGGSPYDRTNCRLAHRLCNARRGNGLRQQRRRMVPPFTITASTQAPPPLPPDATADPGHCALHTGEN